MVYSSLRKKKVKMLYEAFWWLNREKHRLVKYMIYFYSNNINHIFGIQTLLISGKYLSAETNLLSENGYI